MFWTFSILLIVLWLMGMVTGYTLGGAIHIMPVVAVISAILAGLRKHRHRAPHFGGSHGRGAL